MMDIYGKIGIIQRVKMTRHIWISNALCQQIQFFLHPKKDGGGRLVVARHRLWGGVCLIVVRVSHRSCKDWTIVCGAAPVSWLWRPGLRLLMRRRMGWMIFAWGWFRLELSLLCLRTQNSLSCFLGGRSSGQSNVCASTHIQCPDRLESWGCEVRWGGKRSLISQQLGISTTSLTGSPSYTQ